jgi:hypothetical protein
MTRFNSKIISVMVCILFLLNLALPTQIEASGFSAQTANPVAHSQTRAQMTTAEKGQMICALSGALVLFVVEIWFIVAGFKASVGWGLFMLFVGGMRSIFAALAMIGWIVRWIWLTHTHWNEPLNEPF